MLYFRLLEKLLLIQCKMYILYTVSKNWWSKENYLKMKICKMKIGIDSYHILRNKIKKEKKLLKKRRVIINYYYRIYTISTWIITKKGGFIDGFWRILFKWKVKIIKEIGRKKEKIIIKEIKLIESRWRLRIGIRIRLRIWLIREWSIISKKLTIRYRRY